MKGKRKRNQYKVGNCPSIAFCTLTTDQGCGVNNGVAPSTAPSTPPSTQVLKQLSMHPKLKKCALQSKLLRPHKLSDDYLDEYLEDKSTENRTVDRDLNILMINSLIICHLNKSPKCVVPHFELVQETQWGLGWIWKMKCTNCKFISEKYKLFREIDTGRAGRKSATINYGFQTGVINCNIGNDSARLLLTSSCIPPMSKGTMQRITNTVCDKVVKLAENETEQVVESFRKRNETLGLNKNSPIKLQMDGTYQSVHIKVGIKWDKCITSYWYCL
ncbi:unnamed protein product [Mytilus edulis]|uniref:Mutator-like transposase domain-containing protein n=1 Tax=Mytilus edulis TaxID=6550 RepID=A0A8S3SQF2_MYTED|nr:unnamed protein product [Mytilus edulis]